MTRWGKRICCFIGKAYRPALEARSSLPAATYGMAALNAALDDGADAPPSPQPVEAATAAAAAAGTASDAAALACAGWTTATTLCILRHVAAMSRAGDLTADEKAAVKSGAARMHGFLLGAALLFDEVSPQCLAMQPPLWIRAPWMYVKNVLTHPSLLTCSIDGRRGGVP